MEILSLGEKIKRRRKDLNMTLKDLAGDRITPGQISLVESGKSNPSMDLLEYLADALNTSIEYLMESEETQAEKICTCYENIIKSFILNNDLSSSEKYVESALQYADKYNLHYRKAKNLYFRGIIYMKRDEVSLAQQFFLSANILFIKLNSYEDIINTFLKLGIITVNTKAYNSAYSYFKQAEKVFMDNDTGNDFLLGEIYYYIGYTMHKLENENEAIRYSNMANKKFREIDNKKEYARTLLNITLDYSDKGDINNAIKYSKMSFNAFQEIDDTSYHAEIENNLGKLFYEYENYEESFVHLNKSKELRERNKDDKINETLINICENYIKLKEIDNAKVTLEEIYNYTKELKSKHMINYYILKYRIEFLEGKLKMAEDTLLEAVSYAEKFELNREKAEVAIILGKFYIDRGKSNEAAENLTKAVETFKALGIFKGFE
jgi:transcriptional regulator with XRE-family HTH domain